MKPPANLVVFRQFTELEFAATLSSAELKRLRRLVKNGEYVRLHNGVYIAKKESQEEVELIVRQSWQKIAD